jgi:thiamine-phosphate pyrophosphorylase
MVLKGFYVITDEVLTPYQDGEIFRMVEKALKGGAKFVQLRDKNSDLDVLTNIAIELKKLCHRFGAYFIVNDRVDLAAKVLADGVHVGKDDQPLSQVKEIFKGPIIGVSCYGDLRRAMEAEKQGATYVAFGSFYPSPTKPNSTVVDKTLIPLAKKTLKIPVCAIGGITLERAKELVQLGADMVAVISDLWKDNDIEGKARAYAKLFE